MTVKTSFGTQAVQKPLQNIVRDEDRTVTDKKYKIVFYVVLTVWLASCIGVLYNASKLGPVQKKEVEHAKSLQWITRTPEHTNFNRLTDILFLNMGSQYNLDTYYKESGPSFVWQSMLFCSAMTILGMTFMWMASIRSPATLVLISSTLISLSIIYHTATYFSNDCQNREPIFKKLLYWVGPEAALAVCTILVLFLVACINGIKKTRRLMTEVLRYYFTCRYLILAGFLVCLMIALLNAFSGIVLENISRTTEYSNTMYWIIYSGSVYMIILTYTLVRMIISATAASYYWDKDSEKSPFKTMCQKIIVIFKYNFGSACGMATYSTFLHTVIIGYVMGFGFTNYKLDKYCLIFYVLYVLNYDYIIFFTSIYGLRFSQAFTRFCCFYRESGTWFLSSSLWIYFGAFFILLSTHSMMLFLKWGLNEQDTVFSGMSYLCYVEILIIFLPVLILFGTIEETRYVCIMCGTGKKRSATNGRSSLKKAIIDKKSQDLV